MSPLLEKKKKKKKLLLESSEDPNLRQEVTSKDGNLKRKKGGGGNHLHPSWRQIWRECRHMFSFRHTHMTYTRSRASRLPTKSVVFTWGDSLYSVLQGLQTLAYLSIELIAFVLFC